MNKKILFLAASVILLPLVGAGCLKMDQTANINQPVAAPVVLPPAVNQPVVIPVGQPAVEKPTVVINGLTFDLPQGWELLGVETNGGESVAKIKVPDPKFKVVIPFYVDRVTKPNDEQLGSSAPPLKTTASGAKVYLGASAPTLAYYEVSYKGLAYGVTFAVPESDEPAPANLDGVWYPSTTVTEEEMLNFVSTIR